MLYNRKKQRFVAWKFLNFVPDQTVPNLVIVKVGTGLPPFPITQLPGYVAFYNKFGTTHLIVDIAGYFTDSTVEPTALGNAVTAEEEAMAGFTIG